MESPYPSKKFELRHNVENLVLGIDSSAVIVEDSGKEKKKSTKKNKRIIPQSEVIQSEQELKLRAEALMKREKERDAEKEIKDQRGRSVSRLGFFENVREKFYNKVYGDPSEGIPAALEQMIQKEREEKAKAEKKE